MSKRRRSSSTLRLGVPTAELMIAAPSVMAHRLARMHASGAHPSARDQREFARMSSEKVAAFSESWNQMALQMLKENQQLAQAWMSAWWLPARFPARTAARMQNSALRVLSSGLAPVHRRATANARRLGRAKAR